VEVAPDGATREETTEGLVVIKAAGMTVDSPPGYEVRVMVGQAPVEPVPVAVPAMAPAIMGGVEQPPETTVMNVENVSSGINSGLVPVIYHARAGFE